MAAAAGDAPQRTAALWEGQLEKRAGGGKVALSEWATRWFQLRGGALIYYEEKGRVDLTTGCKVTVRGEDGAQGFLLEAKGKRPLQLRAPSTAERDDWVRILGNSGVPRPDPGRCALLEAAEAAARNGVHAAWAEGLSATAALAQQRTAALMRQLGGELREARDECLRLGAELERLQTQHEEQLEEMREKLHEADEISSWASVNGLGSLLRRLGQKALMSKPASHRELLTCLRDHLDGEMKEAPGGALASMVRGLVSMNKMRFQEDGFDLDLTYITPRVIAMGFPSHGTEGYYRNPVDQVERFFDQRHRNHFRVYNLCSERTYDRETRFGRNFRRFPFDDHNAPAPIALMWHFVDDARQFHAADPKNVIAVHCKAGKGRTGVMICAYLMATGVHKKASDALVAFASLRTNDGVGVSIPSQIRYVGYYERALRELGGAMPPGRRLRLDRITVRGAGKPGSSSPWDLYFKVQITPAERGGAWDVFDSRKWPKALVQKKADYFEFDLSSPGRVDEPVYVDGDVRVAFYSARRLRGDEHMFHFWVHTHFADTGKEVRFPKAELDKAVKDSKNENFNADLCVTALFSAPPSQAGTKGGLEAGCV